MATRITSRIVAVDSLLRSRGYGGQTMEAKRFRRGVLHAGTWNPVVTVKTRTDQQQDWNTTSVDGTTTNRLKWLRPFDALDHDPANSLDDQPAPYREDYSLDWGQGLEPGSGLDPDALAEFKRRFGVPRRGRWLQVEVRCSQGALSVRSLGVVGDTDLVQPNSAHD